MIISIEGIDGSGKTSVIEYLKEFFRYEPDCIFTKEPGGTVISDKIRDIFVHTDDNDIDTKTELLLAAASMAAKKKLITSQENKDKFIIFDRYMDSFFAYSIGGRKTDAKLVHQIANILAMPEPDIVFLLDINPEVAIKRKLLAQDTNKFDKMDINFFHDVRKFFLERAYYYNKYYNKRYYIINSDIEFEELTELVGPIICTELVKIFKEEEEE